MNEKNNFGFNNDLPKMGSVVSDNTVSNNNTVDKFNLPPISSFTNFDNDNFNNNISIDNNVSVFDLMNEFDSVNNMSRDQAFIKETAQNNIQQTLPSGHNAYNKNQGSFNVSTNSIPVSEPLNNSVIVNQGLNETIEPINTNRTVDNITDSVTFNPIQGVIPVSENINVVESVNNPIMYNQVSSTPVEPMNKIPIADNVTGPINFNIEPNITMEPINTNSVVEQVNSQITFNQIPNAMSEPLNTNKNADNITDSVTFNQTKGVTPVSENINVVESVNNPIMYNQVSSTPVEPINKIPIADNVTGPITFNIESDITMDDLNTNTVAQSVNEPITFNQMKGSSLESANNIPVIESSNAPITFNQVPGVVSEPINTIPVADNVNEPLAFIQGGVVNSVESSNGIVNNQLNNSIPVNEQQINSIAEDVLKQTALNSKPNDNQPVDVLKNTKKELKEDQKKEKKPRKKHKLLLIIILIISFLIIIISLVLSYFMFFKEDKLVCEYQDYSSEDFLLSEVMTINFKGRQMTDAKFVEKLNFTESGLSKKESYQVNLQNQFDGLGFNVSYYEMEDGFEITMDFTKENLESWTGAEIKSATKENLLREMKNSGYTCK